MLVKEIFVYVFIKMRNFLFIPPFLNCFFFYHERVLDFVKCFSLRTEMAHGHVLYCIDIVYYINGFLEVGH